MAQANAATAASSTFDWTVLFILVLLRVFSSGLIVRGTENGLNGGLPHAGKFSAGLPAVFEAELADHAVEVAGEGGEVFERFDSLFGALGVFDCDL
jgi:hypothetical protein